MDNGKPREGQLCRLVIDGYASDGAGVARLDGMVVFVQGGIRGEACDVRLTHVGRSALWGRVEEVVNPSPAQKDGLLGRAGTRLPAHEFHYWDSDAPGSDFRADKPQSSRGWDCAFHTPTLYAGFPHFHFWAAPSAARNFVAAARRYVQEASL